MIRMEDSEGSGLCCWNGVFRFWYSFFFLASALGMNYVFAESWAPQYGNTVLSKWPIKRWKLQKIFDHHDYRLWRLST